MIVIWSHFISILFLELELSRDLAWADPHLAVVWVVIRTLKKNKQKQIFRYFTSSRIYFGPLPMWFNPGPNKTL